VICVLFYVDAIAIVTENGLRNIINDNFSSLYYVALLHSTLANVSTPWSGDGAPWWLQGSGGHHGWGVFVLLLHQKWTNILFPTWRRAVKYKCQY
jgi:hypothetical protein